MTFRKPRSRILSSIFAIALLCAAGVVAQQPSGQTGQKAVHTVTAEPGVVPPGTFLVVRTSDTVSTRRAYRGTIYDAIVAEDVLDQSERVLIPKGSPIELAVRSFSFLGPGGVGMTELRLAALTVTVNGVRYPVETGETHEGLGANRTGSGEGSQLMTRGGGINVPTGTLLTFRIEDPIRLRGYRPVNKGV